MSNFSQMTKHPRTGEIQMADWIDDHFGHHRYGVRFPDGRVFPDSEVKAIVVEGVEVTTHLNRPVPQPEERTT